MTWITNILEIAFHSRVGLSLVSYEPLQSVPIAASLWLYVLFHDFHSPAGSSPTYSLSFSQVQRVQFFSIVSSVRPSNEET